LLALNLARDAVTLDIPSPAYAYVLTSSSPKGQMVLLNGSSLSLGTNDRIPELRGRPLPAGQVKLPPTSIAFITVPQARNANCQ
jgi:hypothetical protein